MLEVTDTLLRDSIFLYFKLRGLEFPEKSLTENKFGRKKMKETDEERLILSKIKQLSNWAIPPNTTIIIYYM